MEKSLAQTKETKTPTREVAPAQGFVQVALFVLSIGAVFIYLGYEVSNIQGKGMKSAPPGVNAERGEIIFWDPVQGVCHRCHMIGGRGTMTRCPNLGESDLGAPILRRAALRAEERFKQTGIPYTAVDYIIESLASPGIYVVEGFPSNLMPMVYTGQTDLSAEDVMSVVAYLQSLDDDVDIDQIQKSMSRHGQAILNKDRLSAEVQVLAINFQRPEWVVLLADKLDAYRELGVSERAMFLEAELTEEEQEELQEEISYWLEDGRDTFETMKCWQCHTILGEDFGPLEQGEVGPELTGIGEIQTYEYLRESILNPNAVIVPPIADHTDDDGRSKMPIYEDSLVIRDLDRLAFYLSNLSATQPAEMSEGASDE